MKTSGRIALTSRPVVLNGFMATGKSTVGRLVAERLGRPFVDLDRDIEETAGASVSAVFRERGEAAFRALEHDAVERALGRSDAPVVAVGGGALLDRARRLDALDRAVVVVLEASVGEIVQRATAQGGRPLLDVSDPAARVGELLEQRREAYLEAHARIPTDGRAPDAIAAQIAELCARDPIAVAAGERTYNVEVVQGAGAFRAASLLVGATATLMVTDRNVDAHHGDAALRALSAASAAVTRFVLEPGEEHKHIGSVERIWRAALDAGLDRGSVLVALGGGVASDITGFAAATWMRGVPWVCVPTTLLSMVDASVGGKTAVDLADAKNCVGAFWQPRGVVCDVDLLRTEPARGFSSALSEVVKTALIGDPELLSLLETEGARIAARDPALISDIVRRCVRVKARVVGLDERESGVRATLNLGHTIGHALEAHGGYTRLTHGEAVSLGLVAALRIGETLGITPSDLTARVVALLAALGLPHALEGEPLAEAATLVGRDKKRAGARLRFVAARAPGAVETVSLEVERVCEAMRRLS